MPNSQIRPVAPQEVELLTKLARFSEILNESYDLEAVLERFLDLLVQELGAERGSILLDRGGSEPELVCSRGATYGYSHSVLAQAMAGEEILTLDAITDNRFSASASLRKMNMHSILCVPMQRGEQVLGLIYLDNASSSGVFAPEHLAIVRVLAGMVAIAIERAFFYRRSVHEEKLAAMGALLAGLSHELNNPLTTVLCCAQIMEQELTDPEHREMAASIFREGRRCQSLVTDTLRSCRRQPIPTRELSLNECVNSVIHLSQAEFRRQGAVLECHLDPDLPLFPGVREHMIQVILNLVQNARLAVADREGGRVTVRTSFRPRLVRLQVSDNGPGVPPAQLKQIFDPFFTTRGERGNGLGLALVSRVASEHGGTISVRNQPEGGAVFTLEIALRQEAIVAGAA